MSRRRTRAEIAKLDAEEDTAQAGASKIVAESAAMLLQPMQEQILALSNRLAEVQQQLFSTQTELTETRRVAAATAAVLAEHARWDDLVAQTLRGHSIQVPPAPPLHVPDVQTP